MPKGVDIKSIKPDDMIFYDDASVPYNFDIILRSLYSTCGRWLKEGDSVERTCADYFSTGAQAIKDVPMLEADLAGLSSEIEKRFNLFYSGKKGFKDQIEQKDDIVISPTIGPVLEAYAKEVIRHEPVDFVKFSGDYFKACVSKNLTGFLQLECLKKHDTQT